MIRRAEKGDIPALLRLLEQVNRVHWQGRPDLFNLATKYSPEELDALLRDGRRPVFVWTDEDGQVQGYAFCVLEKHRGERLLADRTDLYIDDLCVDEQMRGRHIGTQLYEHVCGYARSLGCQSVTLNVWCLNEAAMRFYEKLGLTPYRVGMERRL